MSLRYPADGYSGDADYVSFKPMKYSSRGSSGGGGGGYIILYMPERLPVVTNANNWNEFSFGAGPMGGLVESGFDELLNFTNTDFTQPMTKEAKEQGINLSRTRLMSNLLTLVLLGDSSFWRVQRLLLVAPLTRCCQ